MVSHVYPPGPKSAFAAGYSLARDPLRALRELASRYGDIAHMRLLSRHDYLINHPDYIKLVLNAGEEEMLRSFSRPLKPILGNGLLTSQGEFHQRHRRLMQPHFHHEQVANSVRAICDYAAEFAGTLRDGQTIELNEAMLRLTLDIILKALFDLGRDGKTSEINALLPAVIARTNKQSIPYLGQFLAKLPLPAQRRYRRSQDRLDTLIHHMIGERRTCRNGQGDFLAALLRLQDSEGAAGGFGDAEVRDEAVTMFMAGHETMGGALTWTWYLLSLYPEVERLLHEELDCVLGGRIPGAGDFPRLAYTAMVLSESMRLYPPVWLMVRRPVRDFSLGDFVIPAGAYIHISQYVTHHDARFFPDPERFDPNRWTREAVAARPKYSYFPFGGGSRRCIGEGLAWIEGVLVIAILAQRWKFRLVPAHPVEPSPMITLRPKYGMKMTVHRRDANLPAQQSSAHASHTSS
jgi:cytochrome P450